MRWAAAVLLLAWASRAAAFGLDDVAREAERIAREPYRDRQTHVPAWMLEGSMTYDQWRDIRFRPAEALWRTERLPFQVQLFHPGLYFDRTVRVNVVDDTGVHPLAFDPALFDYGKNDFADRIPRDIGYAGIRIHFPIRTPDYYDEVAVFLGASYFRALGRDNVYGLSARGLAIDTVEPGGEEFPRFIEFWLVKPAPADRHLVLYALLDSPTASGAYRFDLMPGEQTRMDVDVRLFPRAAGRKLGLAPLTSMFFFGENTTRCFDDFRPEVHDSDGLLIHFASGEWLWRPLDNPTRINAAGFQTKTPRGFGLVQRDRDFANYQDIETRSELRPSAWVEPRGDWGEGRVELVEIPTADEKLDNIVAYWVPARPPAPGGSLAYAYTLTWYMNDPGRPPGGRALATRRDRGTVDTPRDGYRYVIDFDSPALQALAADDPPRAVVTAGNGARLHDEHVYKNPVTGGWRLAFRVTPKDAEPVELRAYLEHDGDVLTETWAAVWLP
ncbi:MAG TPA: glucan biosynthesis protein G [Candidatus Limnocylindria bacterium]|nr:glucan biosynthesis protein G [Candidatus Limnocylindria bacterium]